MDEYKCEQDVVKALARLRERFSMPRWVGVSTEGELTAIDTSSPIGSRVVFEEAARVPVLVLKELPEQERGLIVGNGERFAHEVVIPARCTGTALGDCEVRVDGAPAAHVVPSEVSIGNDASEWLYIKYFVATSESDSLLSALADDLIGPCMKLGAKGWFFIRYSVPRPHLRVRVKVDDGDARSEVLNMMLAFGAAQTSCYETELSEYRPEVSRYGGDESCLLMEATFQVDSEAMLDLIGRSTLEERWPSLLVMLDDSMAAFGLDLPARSKFVEASVDSFWREFRVIGDRRREVLKRVRVLRSVFGQSGLDIPNVPIGIEHVLRRRRARLEEILQRVRMLRGDWPASVFDLVVGSSMHMTVNRCFPSLQRENEMVVYTVLSQHYRRDVSRGAEP